MDSEAVLRGFRLRSPEARALKKLPRALLEDYCLGLEAKNSARLQTAFKATARLLGGRFAAWYRHYADRHSELRDWPDKIEAFAVLLFHELRREAFPENALELARFEYQKAMLAHWHGRGVPPGLLRRLGVSRVRGGFKGRYALDVLALAEGRRPGPRRQVLFYASSRNGPLKAKSFG